MSKYITLKDSGKLCYNCGNPLYILPDRLQCIDMGCGAYSKKAIPQPKEEKKPYNLRFTEDSIRIVGASVDKDLHLTEPAAQSVARAIEALLEYVNLPYDYDNPNGHISHGREAIFHKARAAVQEEK